MSSLAAHPDTVVVTTGDHKPRMLHLPECWHFVDGTTETRPATADERKTLPDCMACARLTDS